MTRRFQGLAVCSPTPGRLDVFAGAENGVWHKVHNVFEGTWSKWEPLGGDTPSYGYFYGLAAISSGPNRIELVLKDPTNKLLHKRFLDGEWSDWKSHGSLSPSSNLRDLTIVASDPDHLSVLYNIGDRGETICHWQLGGNQSEFYSPWQHSSKLKAVSLAQGRFDLFVRPLFLQSGSYPNTILRRRFEGGWSDWESVGIPPVGLSLYYNESGIAATASLDVFAVGRDKQLWHRKLDVQNSNWHALGGNLGGDLAAVSWGQDRIDVFAIWNGVALMHRYYDGQWTNWKVVDIWPGPTNYYSVLRPQDLVSLELYGVGLREQIQSNGMVELVPQNANARLIVSFPPQHVSEEVLPSCPPISIPPTCGLAEEASINAWIARSSRLAFTVNKSIPLSVSGVLDTIRRLPLLPTKPINPPTIPNSNETAIELPWRLMISPQEKTNCTHRELPGTSEAGVTELWHIRLSGSRSSGQLDVRPLFVLSQDNLNTTLSANQLNYITQIGSNPAKLPITVDRLILSTLGGWLSATANWPEINWSHEAAMGRDYYVRVTKSGVLFPLRHQVVYMEISERRFSSHINRPKRLGVAALRKSYFLIVTEPEREYGIGSSSQYEREFPFQKVTIEPRQMQLQSPTSGDYFWPKRPDGTPVEFLVRARAGQDIVELKMPLLFVSKPINVDIDTLNREYDKGPTGQGKLPVLVGRSIPLAMKTVSEPLEGAIQEVHSMMFGGVSVSSSDVGFYPKVTQMEVALPAIRQLLGERKPLPVKFSNQFVHALSGEQSDVLLDLINSKVLPFTSAAEQTGALAAPDFMVDQISRSEGPIRSTNVNPSDLFDEGAKLLGVIKLRDIISRITKPPKVIWTKADGTTSPTATFKWHQILDKPFEPFKPGDNSYIDLEVVSKIVDGKPMMNATGVLKNFSLNLMDVVDLEFKQLCFTSNTGQRPNITFDFKRAELKGKMKFIKTLQSKIPNMGRGGPNIEVSHNEIKATYRVSVPTLALGPVFTLQNLSVDTGLTLSLNNQPAIVNFAFCTQERQFLVTVSMFGGGGFLELGISADKGLQRLVGGIAFGASVAMDFIIARGEVHVLGGFVFDNQGKTVEITGYLRIGGSVEVLGLIRISVELTVSLTYNEGQNALIGAARLVVAVDLTFWSTSVELECHQRFDGSSLSIVEEPRCDTNVSQRASSIEATLGPQGESYPWETYCRAFASEPR